MWQASVARCLPTPPYGCYTAGLRPSLSGGSRRESYWSTIVIGNCAFWTDHGGAPPSESMLQSRKPCDSEPHGQNTFTRSSILFRPLNVHPNDVN